MYDYKKLKKSKSVKMKTDGKDFFLSINRFDQNTGEKIEPLVVMLHRDRLELNKVAHEKEVEDTVAILRDMDILERRKK